MRRLSAIMFADMAGYTALVQENEAEARVRRRRMRTVLEERVQGAGGELVQFYGDGALSIFPSAIGAVDGAVRIQQDLVRGSPSVDVRIGIHIGDVVHDEDGVFGDGVNVASRVESLGVPGAVLISGKVYEELRNQPHLATQLLGDVELKNVQRPTRIYAVVAEDLVVPDGIGGKAKSAATQLAVAVLPFVNMSPDPENEYFCDGVTEELINLLTRINGLPVTARTSSFAFKGRDLDVRAIGRELGVSRVLEGSVRRSGMRVRITAQLIETETGYHLFSQVYDRTIEDVFDTQDEIAATIVAALETDLTPAPAPGATDVRRKMDPEAHHTMLRGLHYFNLSTPADMKRAIEDYEEAHRLDPDAALPLSHLAHVKTRLATMGQLPTTAFQEAEDAVLAAIEREPGLGEAHVTLGIIRLLYHWDGPGAFEAVQRGLALSPGSAHARSTNSLYLSIIGETEAAIDEMELALSLDPLSAVLQTDLAFIYLKGGRFDQAYEAADRALELAPHLRNAEELKGWVHLGRGKPEQALSAFGRYHKLVGDPRKGITGLGVSHAVVGDTGKAREILGLLHERAEAEPGISMDLDIALVHIGLGEFDRAMDYFEASFDRRIGSLLLMRFHPLLLPLENHPRWTAMWARSDL